MVVFLKKKKFTEKDSNDTWISLDDLHDHAGCFFEVEDVSDEESFYSAMSPDKRHNLKNFWYVREDLSGTDWDDFYILKSLCSSMREKLDKILE